MSASTTTTLTGGLSSLPTTSAALVASTDLKSTTTSAIAVASKVSAASDSAAASSGTAAAQDDKYDGAYYFPPEVNPKHLYKTRKLLREATIARLNLLLRDKPYGRYSKDLCGVPYGIFKGRRGLYAIYNDDRQQVELGKGGFGSIKIVQHLESGKWFALKTVINDHRIYY